MSKWQNLSVGFFEETAGQYQFPIVEPVFELPKVDKYIEFDYCNRIRDGQEKIGVHFFEPDYKFERCWTGPDRYGEMLSKFGFVIGPDFSTYPDFPLAVRIYNHYRNNWLARYWQICYNMTVIPTVLWGLEDSYEFCFDGLPSHSIVAVTNVGIGNAKADKENWLKGYNKMLEVLEPSQILFYSRNFEPVQGNVKYIRWAMHKGDQLL